MNNPGIDFIDDYYYTPENTNHIYSNHLGKKAETMNTDALIGASLLFLALGIILFVLFWSRRIIRFIDKNKLNSAREILKKFHEKH